jgi:subtilase family serine protease
MMSAWNKGRAWWLSGLVLAGCAAEVGPEGVDQAAATPPRPDLAITRLVGPPATTGNFTAELQACNRGQAPAPSSNANVYVSRDRRIIGLGQQGMDPFAGSLVVPPLSPGQCATVTGSLFVSVPTEGPYYLAANIDEPSSIAESNERNNQFIGVLMGIGFRSDLIVSSVSGPASTTGELVATVRVCNQGTQPSGPNQANVYLSLDTLLRGVVAYPTSADPLLGQVPVPPLQPGQCQNASQTFWAPVPGPGAYYLAAFVDEHRSEPELNDNNNSLIGGLMGVGFGADLVVDAIVGPASSNGPLSVDVRVCNRGTNHSAPQTAHLYLSADNRIQGVFELPTTPDRLVAPVQIPSLAPGRCATGEANGHSPFPQGVYYLGAIIDEMNNEPELIESNNRLTGSLIGLGNGPDLVVDSITGPASSNGNFDLTVRICNQGTGPSSNADVALYLTADTTLDTSQNPWADPFLGMATVAPLQPGQCGDATRNVFAPVPQNGAYYLAAVADPFLSVPELIESNNRRIGGLIGLGFGPDLIVTQIDAPASTQGELSISARICNQGTSDSGNTDLAIYLSSDEILEGLNQPWPGDNFAGTVPVPPLSPGQCSTLSQLLYAPVFQNGAFLILGQLDPWNTQPELIESNNTFVGPQIGAGFGPDLVIRAFDAPPSTQNNFSATLTVCNQGTTPSNPAEVLAYLSSDEVIEVAGPGPSDDAMIGQVSVDSLQPGQCVRVQGDFNAFVFGGPGAYHLGAVIDPFNNQPELIETNNTFLAGLIGVGPGSDLVVHSLITPASAQPGTPVNVTARICNQGTQMSGPSQVAIFASRDRTISTINQLSPDDFFAGMLETPNLDAGACANSVGALSFFPIQGDGAYYVAARVDEFNNELELIESNNLFIGEPIGVGQGPDLVATMITAPATSNGAFEATIRLCNQGTQPAWAGDVALYLSTDTVIDTNPSPFNTDGLAGLFHYDNLQPGQCANRTEQVFAGVPTLGEHYLAAVVDPWGATPELREDNNLYVGGIIGLGNGPDLVIQNLSGPSSSNGPLNVSARICNQGNTGSPTSELAIYLSNDTVVEGVQNPWPGDPFAGTISVPELMVGECRTVNQELYAPFANQGAYYLIGVIDQFGNVSELVESNNTLVGALVGLGSGSDLVVTQLTGPASTFGNFQGAARVCNQGTTGSGPTTVLIYLSADQVLVPVSGNPAQADHVAGELQVPNLQAGQCVDTQGELQAFGLSGPGAYYLAGQVDPWGSELELIESNNTLFGALIGVGPGADLVVTAITAPGSANGNFNASARVCNQGTTPSSPNQVNFYLSRDQIVVASGAPVFEDAFLGQLPVPNLQAGECRTVEGELSAFAFDGDGAYYLGTIIDEWQSEPELVEGNNTFVGGLIGVGFGPDLVIRSVTGPASTNGPVSVTARVCNQGTAQASPGAVAVHLSLDGTLEQTPPANDPFLGTLNHGSLNAGQCQNVTAELFAPIFQNGPYFLVGVADPTASQNELIESNNVHFGQVIGVGNGPDLVVTALEGPASTTGELPVTVTICNQGNQPSASGETAIFLSTDQVLDGMQNPWPGDAFAGTVNFAPLAPGDCQVVSQQLYAPVFSSGAHYLLAQVDPWQNQAELQEANNLFVGELIGVGFGPDLVVTQFDAPASTFGSFQGTLTVCNQGTMGSGPSEATIYVSTDEVIEGAGSNPALGDNFAGIISFPSLAPGQCTSVTQDLYAAVFGPGGAFYLGVLVDEWNNVPELLEGNNTFVGGQLGIGPGADLIVTQVVAPATTNGPFSPSVTVCNQGTTHAGPNQVSMYLSADEELVTFADNQPGSEDFFAGIIQTPDLAPGSCSTVSQPLWVGGPFGTYQVGAVVDEFGNEPELIEGNNRGFYGTIELLP